MKIRIAIVNNQVLFRKGLIKILSEYNDFDIWGEFDVLEDFIETIGVSEQNQPSILLSDQVMYHKNNRRLRAWIKNHIPDLKLLVVGSKSDEEFKRLVIRNGAKGLIATSSPISEILQAISCALKSNFYVNEMISEEDLINLIQKKKNPVNNFTKDLKLTKREKDIIKLICQEYSYKDIAYRLSISKRTVETHKNNILAKIGANKVTGLVLYAAKANLV